MGTFVVERIRFDQNTTDTSVSIGPNSDLNDKGERKEKKERARVRVR